MTPLEADVADAFRRHRRRLAVAGIASADLNAVEALARMLVRLHDNARLQPTKGGVDDDEAHTVPMNLLNLDDCAMALAVSRRSVERLTRTGALATVNVGPGSVRVRRSDLDAFMSGLESRVRTEPAARDHTPPQDPEYTAGVDVLTGVNIDEVRAEHASLGRSLGREEMSYAEKRRVESIVAEMTEASEHRDDTGAMRVVWQREGHDVGLERRFATATAADAFAAELGANHEAGRLVRLDVLDGQGTGPVGPDAGAVRRAVLARRQH